MRVLIGCEYSGIVRDAFRALGHDAWSCDLLPTEQPGPHILDDVRNVLDWDWDLLVAHPPCTYSSYAGNRWLQQPGRHAKMLASFELFEALWNAPIEHIAIENPRGYVEQYWRKPDDLIHPYYFGDPMTKATCFWLKNLPPLMATNIIANPFVNWTKKGKGGHNGKSRSRTFQGLAAAIADQWGRAAHCASRRRAAGVSAGRRGAGLETLDH